MKIESGQVAVVTGGTSGIGLALAALLVQRGVDVMIADIREDAIPTAVDALSGHAGRAVGVRADVSVDADVDALADETIERFGRVAPYNATMHAVVGLTETLNAELQSLSKGLGATVLCPGMVDTPLGQNSARLTPPGAAATPADRDDDAMRGAISPAAVAEAAIAAVESGLVHAVLGPGAAEAAKRRVDALLADLV